MWWTVSVVEGEGGGDFSSGSSGGGGGGDAINLVSPAPMTFKWLPRHAFRGEMIRTGTGFMMNFLYSTNFVRCGCGWGFFIGCGWGNPGG